MARVVHAVRFVGNDLDFATWYAHLAAHPTPARLLFLKPRREVARSPRGQQRRMEPLDLATWRARLSGVERRAA
jgi:hypothetical protein